MFTKIEIIGAALSIMAMATALYLLQTESRLATLQDTNAITQPASGIVAISDDFSDAERKQAYMSAVDETGEISLLIVDDIKIGSGESVKEGDTVSIHYRGSLMNGQEFGNTNKTGEALEFTVGEGEVIDGLEEGILGMKVGGERVLVIPPEKAYGNLEAGPIPAGSTLLFSIELLSV